MPRILLLSYQSSKVGRHSMRGALLAPYAHYSRGISSPNRMSSSLTPQAPRSFLSHTAGMQAVLTATCGGWSHRIQKTQTSHLSSTFGIRCPALTIAVPSATCSHRFAPSSSYRYYTRRWGDKLGCRGRHTVGGTSPSLGSPQLITIYGTVSLLNEMGTSERRSSRCNPRVITTACFTPGTSGHT